MKLPFRVKIKVRVVVLTIVLLSILCVYLSYSGVLNSHDIRLENTTNKITSSKTWKVPAVKGSNQKIKADNKVNDFYDTKVAQNAENVNIDNDHFDVWQEMNITFFDPNDSKIRYYIDGKDTSFVKSQINKSRMAGGFWRNGFPLTPYEAVHRYGKFLPPWERYEILHYSKVYYLGLGANKTQLTRNASNNFGFDHEIYNKQLLGQPYKVVVGDHIGYRYEIVKYLDFGGFGEVVLARDWSNPKARNVAIKIRHIPRKRKFFYREVELMKHITKYASNVDYFSRMIASFKFRNHVCFVFDLLGKPIDDDLSEGPIRNITLLRRFADDILHGLFYLQELNVIHGDLKLDNILYIYGKDKKSEGQLLKIADFGVGCIPHNEGYPCSSYEIQNLYYRAPEVLLGLPVTHQVDMFSLGMILTNLYFGILPFVGETEADQLAAMMEVLGLPPTYMIANSTRKEIYSEAICSITKSGFHRRPYRLALTNFRKKVKPALFDLIARCLEYNPKLRITSAEALRHPFITGVYPATGFVEPILVQRILGKV